MSDFSTPLSQFQHLRLTVVLAGSVDISKVIPFIELATSPEHGWIIYLVMTPMATALLSKEMKQMVGSYMSKPSADPHALLMMGATLNSLGKLAAGITDSYALDKASQAIAMKGTPVIVAPSCHAYQRPKALERNLRHLREEGVTVLPPNLKTKKEATHAETLRFVEQTWAAWVRVLLYRLLFRVADIVDSGKSTIWRLEDLS